jgi:hypothetical protein
VREAQINFILRSMIFRSILATDLRLEKRARDTMDLECDSAESNHWLL